MILFKLKFIIKILSKPITASAAINPTCFPTIKQPYKSPPLFTTIPQPSTPGFVGGFLFELYKPLINQKSRKKKFF